MQFFGIISSVVQKNAFVELLKSRKAQMMEKLDGTLLENQAVQGRSGTKAGKGRELRIRKKYIQETFNIERNSKKGSIEIWKHAGGKAELKKDHYSASPPP